MFFMAYNKIFMDSKIKFFLINFKRLTSFNTLTSKLPTFHEMEFRVFFNYKGFKRFCFLSFFRKSLRSRTKISKNAFISLPRFTSSSIRQAYMVRKKHSFKKFFRRKKGNFYFSYNVFGLKVLSLKKRIFSRSTKLGLYNVRLKHLYNFDGCCNRFFFTTERINKRVFLFFFLKSIKRYKLKVKIVKLYNFSFYKFKKKNKILVRNRLFKRKYFRKYFKFWRFLKKLSLLNNTSFYFIKRGYIVRKIKMKKNFLLRRQKWKKSNFNFLLKKTRLFITLPKLTYSFSSNKLILPTPFFSFNFSYPLKYFLRILNKRYMVDSTSKVLSSIHVFFKKIKKTFSTNLLLRTLHNCSFIIQNIGLVLPSRFIYKDKKHTNLFAVKKKSFSFLKPNEYKMHIFNFRRRYMFWKFFSYRKKISKNMFNENKYNFFNEEFLGYDKLNTLRKNFINSNIFNLSNFIYDSGKRSLHGDYPEVRVSRIRFKPGYQRLWRGYRRALAELINFKYVYQQQLTYYIVKFYRKLNQHNISASESLISKTLIYSKLIPDLNSFLLFFDNKMIFLNSKVLCNTKLYVYRNDYIQLEVSNWYYIFSRWLLSFSKNRQQRLKRLVFKKSLPSKYKLMKQRKQRSYYTPNWIIHSEYDFKDVKPFLEVDFMTLSVFLIYDYNEFYYYSPLDIRFIKYNIYKMYNWKYVV